MVEKETDSHKVPPFSYLIENRGLFVDPRVPDLLSKYFNEGPTRFTRQAAEKLIGFGYSIYSLTGASVQRLAAKNGYELRSTDIDIHAPGRPLDVAVPMELDRTILRQPQSLTFLHHIQDALLADYRQNFTGATIEIGKTRDSVEMLLRLKQEYGAALFAGQPSIKVMSQLDGGEPIIIALSDKQIEIAPADMDAPLPNVGIFTLTYPNITVILTPQIKNHTLKPIEFNLN